MRKCVMPTVVSKRYGHGSQQTTTMPNYIFRIRHGHDELVPITRYTIIQIARNRIVLSDIFLYISTPNAVFERVANISWENAVCKFCDPYVRMHRYDRGTWISMMDRWFWDLGAVVQKIEVATFVRLHPNRNCLVK
eukprot:SAG31_NODE_2665_length_5274_cov_25.628213_1_plen_136_part_00